MTRVYVACSARNAGRWIDAFISSLVAQDHNDWELWVRNDGSMDDTGIRLEEWRRKEPRVAQVVQGEGSLGIAQGFADVLRRLPRDAELVAMGDADDVWLPHRLSRGLALMDKMRATHAAPLLVLSDLRVVDAELRELAPSYWRSEGLNPARVALSSVVIENVAVNPTLLFNAALLAELRDIPSSAVFADWWIAVVAAVTGQLAVLEEPTVLYRRHGGNDSARRGSWPSRLRMAWARRGAVKDGLNRMSRQAGALVAKYGHRMSVADRKTIEGLASIAELNGWRRKVAIARWRWLSNHGVLRNLGVVVRG